MVDIIPLVVRILTVSGMILTTLLYQALVEERIHHQHICYSTEEEILILKSKVHRHLKELQVVQMKKLKIQIQRTKPTYTNWIENDFKIDKYI